MDFVDVLATPMQHDPPQPSVRVVPDEMPRPMPRQDLQHWKAQQRVPHAPDRSRAWLRRILVCTATLVLTATASSELYQVFDTRTMTALHIAMLVVFTLNFVWIALPCVSGLAGLLACWRGGGVSGITLPALSPLPTLTTRTALLMPIYNEAPPRIFAGLQAIYEALDSLGTLDHFDFFILSDTTDPAIWLEEERGFSTLRQRTKGEARIFYRHRSQNIRRKAGNIEDFCRRWGAYYAHMVILDADSIMTAEALVRLAAAMECHPEAGLMQSFPLVVNGHTLFARAQQFAARVYGPVQATGLAFWHLGDSIYWGHNAILRIHAFMDYAGMPDLPGRPPFGGPILSHDFVEAALLRRAGWKVYLVPELSGSYEEGPPSLIDFAERDRRWCQGNLQHSRIVPAAGLHGLSRLHLLTGIMSYLVSPLWLLLMVLGLLLAVQAHALRPDYFPHRFALFPTWPIFDAVRALHLFLGTMAVLLAPKVWGFLLLVTDRETVQRCGGILRAGAGVLFEIVLSSLLAPVTMLRQSAVVMSILTGRDAGWKAQRRNDGRIPLRTLVRYHRYHTLGGVLLAGAAYAVSPSLLAWMSPVVLGLLLAMPVSAATGGPAVGRACRRLGLFVTPEETEPPAVLQRTNALLEEWEAHCAPETEVLVRLATDAQLRNLHAAMLPVGDERPRGEYNVDLLLGVAKLADAESVEEAAMLLTSQEKLVVLAHRSGFQRLCQLGSERAHGVLSSC